MKDFTVLTQIRCNVVSKTDNFLVVTILFKNTARCKSQESAPHMPGGLLNTDGY